MSEKIRVKSMSFLTCKGRGFYCIICMSQVFYKYKTRRLFCMNEIAQNEWSHMYEMHGKL